MAEFHYKMIIPAFNPQEGVNTNVKLLMTDTDSFCYHINQPATTVYPTLKTIPWMDFSNYSKSKRYSSYTDLKHYLKPGYFKGMKLNINNLSLKNDLDEGGGNFIREFVGITKLLCNRYQ